MRPQLPIKIALLAAGNSVHTVRWANALAERDYDVRLITLNRVNDDIRRDVTVHQLPFPAPAGYFLNIPFLRRYLKRNSPDILHAHYAAGYGTLGRLAGFHPYVLSVWGSDVYYIPTKGKWHLKTIQKNIQAADWICSTSHDMARQTTSVQPSDRKMSITPFGIDVDQFHRFEITNRESITIGTVKTLIPTYGIDILIRGFAECRKKLQTANADLFRKMRLRIAGGGSDRSNLEKLTRQLGVDDVTTFVGEISHAQVPYELQKLDIFVAASRSESFGVSVLEASACQTPVIVSNVGGLPETVQHETTGFVVPTESPSELAARLKQLVENEELREQLGENGRVFVAEKYSWPNSVSRMENVYHQVLDGAAIGPQNSDRIENVTAAEARDDQERE